MKSRADALIAAPEELKIVHAVCPHDCPDTCGMKITVIDGRAVAIAGDQSHPVTRGFLCGKVGQHYLDMVYSPRRVLTPRRRVGAKGAGAFVEISWDEAYTEITTRFHEIVARYGPEAILPYSYSGTLGLLNEGSMDRRFFHRLGASLLDRTICSEAGTAGYWYTLGASLGTDPEAFALARYIIVWGSNPVTSNVHLMPFIKAARRQGARLVVIDPRRTRTAAQADWYIPIRPGTDAALALGVMHVLIRDGLADMAYIRRATVGFEALSQRVMAEYDPGRVSGITGVSVVDIEALAHEYGTVTPAVIRANYGLQRHTNGGMMMRAVACLPALIGAWQHPGGGILLSTSGAFRLNKAALTREDLWPQGKPRTINMNQLGEALLHTDAPPLKALFVYDANPAGSTPNTGKVLEGLRREDLFVVVHDPYFTDTTDYADLVLPATTQLEHLDIHKAYGNYYLQINQPAIAPLGESRSNVRVFRELAAHMGFTEACFKDSEEEMIDQVLASDERETHPWMAGITRAYLMEHGWARLNLPPAPPERTLPDADPEFTADVAAAYAGAGAGESFVSPPESGPTAWAAFLDDAFPTPSGKIELYSEAMARDGYDPLPHHVPLVESPEGDPELARRYPLQLVTPSSHFFLNTSFGHIEGLIAKEKEPFIELSAADASARAIVQGDWVRVFNGRGECFLRAHVGPAVQPGVAAAPTIWWPKFLPAGKGVNHLTSDRLTDMGRGATFYTNLVQVEKAPADLLT